MMNNGERWFTKEDVLKDLDLVTGLRVAEVDDFIVQGNKPPPARYLTEEDEEFQLRYGGLQAPAAETMPPDLAGITRMLRMVDQCNEPPTPPNEINGNIDNKKYNVVISKLNPNVKEFVPSTMSSQVSLTPEEDKMVNGHNGINTNKLKEKNKKDTKNIKTSENSAKNNSDDINENPKAKERHANEQKLQMSELLKSKIIEASKANTLVHKRERNVAIAALMRLNSGPPSSPSNSNINSPKHIKLLTPNFYEETKTAVPIEIKTDVEEIELAETPVNSTSESTAIENKSPEPNKYYTESIDKVNKWLEIDKQDSPKAKPKPKGPVMERITFKKKDASSPSSSSPDPVKAKPADTPSYIPSKYADDLVKRFEERNKAKQHQGQDIWTKLEADLKVRDETIKKRMASRHSAADTSETCSSTSSRR